MRAAALALVLLITPAAAYDHRHAEFFGIKLGSPLTLPSCADVDAKKATPTNGLCVGPDLAAKPDGPKTVSATFTPSDGVPDYSASGDMTVTLGDDETVQAIMLETNGVASQAEVLTLLTAKFGKPFSSRTEIASNAFGARFKVVYVLWSIGTDTVRFDSAPNSFDSGYVEVITLHEEARRAEQTMHSGSQM